MLFLDMSGGASEPSSAPDPRIQFLGRYVQKTLRLKPEKWNRLLAIEEQRTAVLDFLNKPEPLVSFTTITYHVKDLKTGNIYF